MSSVLNQPNHGSYPFEHVNWSAKGPAAASNFHWKSEFWRGTVNDATHAIYKAVILNRQLDPVVWHPSRITAALTNAAIAQADMSEQKPNALSYMSTLTKDLFKGQATSPQVTRLYDFSNHYTIGEQPANHSIDYITVDATNPKVALAAAERLHAKADGRDLFGISMGNSGFLPSILTSLYYEKMSAEPLPVYPVRFSNSFSITPQKKNKPKDIAPQASPAELSYLVEQASGKTVVILDDDSYSGHTIGAAVNYFNSVLPAKVFGLANHDARSADLRTKQGEWFEHYEPDVTS